MFLSRLIYTFTIVRATARVNTHNGGLLKYLASDTITKVLIILP